MLLTDIVNQKIPIEWIGGPAHLPKTVRGRTAVLDVAFASGSKFNQATEPFIQRLGNNLALWCDHHEHAIGWSKYRDDPRFVLAPNREAHACADLVTEQLVNKIGKVECLVLHGDFDGLLSGAKLLNRGVEPYPRADEDARAIDSPGRGHEISQTGQRIAYALDEVVANFTTGQRRDFMTALLWSLVEGSEPMELNAQIDKAASLSLQVQETAMKLAREHGKEENPGLYVIRLAGRREGRQRKVMLRYAEEIAPVGVVIESTDRGAWITAATFDERIDLGEVEKLDGGRSDYRYAQINGSVDPILRQLSRLVDDWNFNILNSKKIGNKSIQSTKAQGNSH